MQKGVLLFVFYIGYGMRRVFGLLFIAMVFVSCGKSRENKQVQVSESVVAVDGLVERTSVTISVVNEGDSVGK